MSNYLWDGSGPPDPDIQQLEQLLAPLRPQSQHLHEMPRRRIPWAAVAAGIVLTVAVWQLFSRAAVQPGAWVMAGNGRRIYTGETLRAAGGEAMALESEQVGKIELQPGSELRLVESAPGRQRMQLQQGRLHAFIWAPPAQFVVDTPSARTIDLGCQYDLSVDKHGNGFLQVQTGWVAFQAGANESFIPAGAACRTTKAGGPGIPYFEDASPEFRTALERLEHGAFDELPVLLKSARQEDALTLWHLLRRVDAAQAGMVFDRFAQLVHLPVDLSRDQVVARDPVALDLSWNALGFADAQWFRGWKRDWR